MKRIAKSIFSLILSAALIIGLYPSRAFAENSNPSDNAEGYVTIDVEKFTLGQGYLVEPVRVPIYTTDSIASVITRLLGDGNYKNTGSVASSFYLSKIKDPSQEPVHIPAYITNKGGPSDSNNTGKRDPDWLGEFDYSKKSGWMFFVNNATANVGSSSCNPKDGDVIRWQYTVWGYGGDLGSSFMGSPLITAANKDGLTEAIAAVNGSADKTGFLAKHSGVYQSAVQTAEDMEASQADTDKAAEDLTKAFQSYGAPTQTKELSVSAKDMSSDVSKHLTASVTNPAFGTLGGDWTVLSLARAEHPVPKNYYDVYYGNVEKKVREVNGVLDTSKMTEYSRLILALTSICKDPHSVAGYNMISPLADYNKIIEQGINGPVFALLALDSANYEIPAVPDGGTQNTRDLMVQYILSKEAKKGTDSAGGWALSSSAPDPDITAMALQALAKYKDQSDVAAAIDRAVTALSTMQTSGGGYSSWGSVNSESISQVIVALTELGIDPATDPRFIKGEGNWLLSALEPFYVPGQGFKHILTGSADPMATDQCAYALAAYNRFADGKNSLYRMSDAKVVLDEDSLVGNSGAISAPGKIGGEVGTKFNITVKVSDWPKDSVKLLEAVVSIPDGLRVDSVTACPALSGGEINYGVDSSNTLRFAYADLNGGKEITAVSGSLPGDLIKIGLTVTDKLSESKTLSFVLKELKFKASSATSYDFQIGSDAVTTVAKSTAITARFLYSGDGSDLIPSDKKAVALEFANFDEPTNAIFYKKDIPLFKSPEMSNRSGVPTYIALVGRDESLDDLDAVANYATYVQKQESVNFGDVNGDGYINAQDALNTLSAWTRKSSDKLNSKSTLSMNVNGDACINTSDVLSMVEYYISDTPFAIISK